MYVIPNWYSETEISNIIGFEWHGSDVDDQFERLLFVDTLKECIEYFDYYPRNGPFFKFCFETDSIKDNRNVSFCRKENCVFISRTVNQKYWKYEVTCLPNEK
jgi:hypothetical protein